MASTINSQSAISAVDREGAMLVFPVMNKKEPHSLWYHFYPRSKMRWEWDDDGDNRVANLWFLREKLSASGKVVYCKWFRGKATLLSKELLPSMLRLLNEKIIADDDYSEISKEALELLKILEDSSPRSTKDLKEVSGLKGKYLEGDYVKRMRELWNHLLIVATGEIDEGAFPSLAISSTKLFFEDEWKAAQELTYVEALKTCESKLGEKSPFFKYLSKNLPRAQPEVHLRKNAKSKNAQMKTSGLNSSRAQMTARRPTISR